MRIVKESFIFILFLISMYKGATICKLAGVLIWNIEMNYKISN